MNNNNEEGLPELPEYLFHKRRANIIEDIPVGTLFHKYAKMPEEQTQIARNLIKKGWVFHVVDQGRGRCYQHKKIITITHWILKMGESKIRWYICHEMAHATVGAGYQHGPVFMAALECICPINDQHWEYGYKPRNAAAGGLSSIGAL